MTNYEWIVTNCEEEVKEILTKHMGKKQWKIKTCVNLYCNDCDFRRALNNGQPCEKTTKAWLDAEYRPPYETGDVVIDKEGNLWVIDVVHDDGVVEVYTKTHLLMTTLMSTIRQKDITKKVGNIYDE